MVDGALRFDDDRERGRESSHHFVLVFQLLAQTASDQGGRLARAQEGAHGLDVFRCQSGRAGRLAMRQRRQQATA